MKTKYRIVQDAYGEYSAQYRHWWYPFWSACFNSGTSSSVDEAIVVAKRHARIVVWSGDIDVLREYSK